MQRGKIYIEKDLTDDQLRQMLGKLIDRLVEKMGMSEDDKKKVMDRKEDIIDSLMHGMKAEHGEIKLQNLNDPKFLNKLFVNLVSTVILAKNMDKLDQLRLTADGKKLDKLDPEDAKELKAQLDNSVKEIDKELNKMRNKPQPERKEQKEDLNVNMLGLVNSFITGGLAAIVTVFLGNANAYPDQNPEHGKSQIDQQNSISDTAYGDPQGFNAQSIDNYLKQTDFDDTLIDSMMKVMQPSATPSLTPPGIET